LSECRVRKPGLLATYSAHSRYVVDI
jgi:hypothetical protein